MAFWIWNIKTQTNQPTSQQNQQQKENHLQGINEKIRDFTYFISVRIGWIVYHEVLKLTLNKTNKKQDNFEEKFQSI